MFLLCRQGWELYDIWAQMLEAKGQDKPTKKEIRQAKETYYQHRRECGECTKPVEQ